MLDDHELFNVTELYGKYRNSINSRTDRIVAAMCQRKHGDSPCQQNCLFIFRRNDICRRICRDKFAAKLEITIVAATDRKQWRNKLEIKSIIDSEESRARHAAEEGGRRTHWARVDQSAIITSSST